MAAFDSMANTAIQYQRNMWVILRLQTACSKSLIWLQTSIFI
jgi:hypothetical protein